MSDGHEIPSSDLPSPASAEARALLDRFRDSCARFGLARRDFIRLLSVGGAGGFLAACARGGNDDEPRRDHFKRAEPFLPHGSRNLEARLDRLDTFITPVERFFVRNNSASILVDPGAYRLRIDGEGVDSPLELTLTDILEMPRRSIFSTIECGGNQRAFFDRVMGRAATGTQWGPGAIGMAEWTGVPLGEVLARAGLRDDAVDVQMIGLDVESPEQGFRRPLPLAQALDPDTLLAYRMNGLPLHADHGFPVRAVVPGWVGSTSIKWLGHVQVTTERVWSRNNTTSYVLIGDSYPPEGEAQGQVATWQTIKSALALPWPARLRAGRQTLRGFAHSPHAAIHAVQWSADDGATWEEATLLPPRMRYAWTRFAIDWEATAGAHTIVARATDEAGNTQPDTLPFNEKGYLFNLPLPHPISVA